MVSSVIVDGDLMVFEPQFGNRIVTIVVPALIKASGHASVGRKKVCINGDEGKVKLSATYITGSHTVPGTGFITIQSLHSSQLAKVSNSPKPLIVVGQDSFTACFTPSSPAMLPPPISTPDTVVATYGKGKFIRSQNIVAA